MPAPPEEPALPIDTCQALLVNALVDSGVAGVDEDIEPMMLNRAFTQVNWLIAQWARKRWLVYRIQDYSFVSTGVQNYMVGLKQTVDINPRPDRLEYAFVRFLNQSGGINPASAASGAAGGGGTGGNFNNDWDSSFNMGGGSAGGGSVPPGFNSLVDISLRIIQSHEDYSRITVKKIGTLSWRIFYDPAWPIGVLKPWPLPQASIYEIHVGFKVILPRFQSLQQPINFPPEYEPALNWGLARRLRVAYQLPADPEITSLARDALNVMRLANSAMSTLRMPSALLSRNKAYSYQSDSADN